jgi:hypothetical protein
MKRLLKQLGRVWRRPSLLAVVMVTMVAAVVMTAICLFGPKGLACLAVAPLLMTLSFYTELPKFSFKQNVADALDGKEGYGLELIYNNGSPNVQLHNAGIYIGNMFERLEGSQAVNVNLRGPIRKGIANAAMVAPCYVKWTAGQLVAGTSGALSCGIAIFPQNIAVGDQVSFIQTDCVMP